MMIISIIGSGNTATVLGRILKHNGHTINEVAGRNINTVQILAADLQANVCVKPNALNKNSDVYIIAVRDDAVRWHASSVTAGPFRGGRSRRARPGCNGHRCRGLDRHVGRRLRAGADTAVEAHRRQHPHGTERWSDRDGRGPVGLRVRHCVVALAP